jgi:hypothetical protein
MVICDSGWRWQHVGEQAVVRHVDRGDPLVFLIVGNLRSAHP